MRLISRLDSRPASPPRQALGTEKHRHEPLADADCQPRRDGRRLRAGLRRLPAVPGDPMDGWTVTLTMKRNIPGEDCVRRTEEPPGEDEIGDKGEARDDDWLREGSEVRNTASDPAPAHSDRIGEMAERIANTTEMLLIRWAYDGERIDERESPRLRSKVLCPGALNATSEMDDGTSSASLIAVHLPMALVTALASLLLVL
ncbi:hypothetical protein DL770_005303 [Monosporascus sp. CRB-9-2]|nr:hypothetical protein DL770_005303 [Monosporascus sp. CRB-9-2]